MPSLRDANPFRKPVADPRSKTTCGGLIAITLLPAILIGYTVWFVRDFVNNRRGFMLTTTQTPATAQLGVRLDSTCTGVCEPDDTMQRLTCMSEHGCWYTVVQDVSGAATADRTCPPRSILEDFDRVSGAIDGMQEALMEGQNVAPAVQNYQNNLNSQLFTKQCLHVERGRTLQGACAYYTQSPLDGMSVTYLDVSNTRADSYGVTLTTPRIEKIEETTGSLLFGGTYFEVRWRNVPLHYGTVNLNVINVDSDNGNMRAEGPLTRNSGSLDSIQEISPSYGYVGETGPDLGFAGTDPCELLCNGAIASATTPNDTPRCVTMKLTPGFNVVTQSYTSSNVVFAFLSSFGGMLTITMLLLGGLHTGLYNTFGERPLCAPDPDGLTKIAGSGKVVSTKEAGLTQTPV